MKKSRKIRKTRSKIHKRKQQKKRTMKKRKRMNKTKKKGGSHTTENNLFKRALKYISKPDLFTGDNSKLTDAYLTNINIMCSDNTTVNDLKQKLEAYVGILDLKNQEKAAMTKKWVKAATTVVKWMNWVMTEASKTNDDRKQQRHLKIHEMSATAAAELENPEDLISKATEAKNKYTDEKLISLIWSDLKKAEAMDAIKAMYNSFQDRVNAMIHSNNIEIQSTHDSIQTAVNETVNMLKTVRNKAGIEGEMLEVMNQNYRIETLNTNMKNMEDAKNAMMDKTKKVVKKTNTVVQPFLLEEYYKIIIDNQSEFNPKDFINKIRELRRTNIHKISQNLSIDITDDNTGLNKADTQDKQALNRLLKDKINKCGANLEDIDLNNLFPIIIRLGIISTMKEIDQMYELNNLLTYKGKNPCGAIDESAKINITQILAHQISRRQLELDTIENMKTTINHYIHFTHNHNSTDYTNILDINDHHHMSCLNYSLGDYLYFKENFELCTDCKKFYDNISMIYETVQSIKKEMKFDKISCSFCKFFSQVSSKLGGYTNENLINFCIDLKYGEFEKCYENGNLEINAYKDALTIGTHIKIRDNETNRRIEVIQPNYTDLSNNLDDMSTMGFMMLKSTDTVNETLKALKENTTFKSNFVSDKEYSDWNKRTYSTYAHYLFAKEMMKLPTNEECIDLYVKLCSQGYILETAKEDYDDAQTKGFENAKSYKHAIKIGIEDAQSYKQATQNGFKNNTNYINAKSMGFFDTYKKQELDENIDIDYLEIKSSTSDNIPYISKDSTIFQDYLVAKALHFEEAERFYNACKNGFLDVKILRKYYTPKKIKQHFLDNSDKTKTSSELYKSKIIVNDFNDAYKRNRMSASEYYTQYKPYDPIIYTPEQVGLV